MCRRIPVISSLIVLLFSIAGCDSFSLLDQFDTTGGLRLVPQKEYLLQGETVDLNPGGGRPPYSFVISEENLYHHGTPGSIADQKYTAGDSIGKMKITLTDGNGNSVEAVVTIIPPVPEGFAVQADLGTLTKDIVVSWALYGSPGIISGLRLERSDGGLPFVVILTLDKNLTTYRDESLDNPSKRYTYRMYAAAGEYLSFPTQELSAIPVPP